MICCVTVTLLRNCISFETSKYSIALLSATFLAVKLPIGDGTGNEPSVMYIIHCIGQHTILEYTETVSTELRTTSTRLSSDSQRRWL